MNSELKPKTQGIRALAVLMKWNYGDPQRGPSSDSEMFLAPLQSICQDVEPFWFDELMADQSALEKALRRRVDEYSPDMVFFLTYTDQFQSAFLDALKNRTRTIAWFGDDHWRFDHYTSKYARHYTLCITADPWAVPKYNKLGAEVFLSQWFATASQPALSPVKNEADFEFDVSFVGIRNEVRSWYVNMLARNAIHVECFGHGWRNGSVSSQRMAEIFNRSRISLNLSNSVPQDIRFLLASPRNAARWLISKKNAEQIKARNFEIPLAGGFQLSRYAPHLERYLDIGREVVVYTSPEECAAQVSYYLQMPEERKRITMAAQKRVMAEHLNTHRLAAIIDHAFPRGKDAA